MIGRPLTDFTRARTSPVVGQTLSNISPDPRHCPSYTPGSSVVVEMPRDDNILDDLLDKHRVKYAPPRPEITLLEKPIRIMRNLKYISPLNLKLFPSI